MPSTEEKERRKSTTDAQKNHKDHHHNGGKKEERRKSTVAKLWGWISTKKDEDKHTRDDSHIKDKKHRAQPKKSRSHTVATVDHNYSDASDDSDIHPGPQPLRRHVSAQPSAPLTPPATPDLPEGDSEEEITPAQAKALEAGIDDTLPIERKLTNVEPKPKKTQQQSPSKDANGVKGHGTKPKQQPSQDSTGKRRRKRRNKQTKNLDVSAPLEFPCTPELVLEYHKRKPFLTQNEEWLMVELNEYECLIENIGIIHKIAKFSKMFELDPPEVLDEFFEFVEEVPSYDEVINSDVWQEFRDVKYPY